MASVPKNNTQGLANTGPKRPTPKGPPVQLPPVPLVRPSLEEDPKPKNDQAPPPDTNNKKNQERQKEKSHEGTDKPEAEQSQKKFAVSNREQQVDQENNKSAEGTTSSNTAASNVNPEQKKTEDSKVGTQSSEKDNSNSSKESGTSSQSSDPSKGGATGSQSSKPEIKSKRLILCFDGTGNKFGTNSNVIRFFNALEKDRPDEQACYYQPGIGTYSARTWITGAMTWLHQKWEEALANELDGHVKEGYEFIMHNYRRGDDILLFGFSRGAYTARALSGMIHKVGLLPPDNSRQIDFAFTVYKSTDPNSAEIGRQFKKIFARSVPVKFVGVWDTVSSVGIIPTMLPHSTYNDGVTYFRHALALDERRARFRGCVWGEPTPTREVMDDDPSIKVEDFDTWEYEPSKITDVREVWFAGCHADVGGGSHEDDEPNSLSFVSLRWMISECVRCELGIVFDEDALVEYNARDELKSGPCTVSLLTKEMELGLKEKGKEEGDLQGKGKGKEEVKDLPKAPAPNLKDVAAKIYDQLLLGSSSRFWWVLETIPTMNLWQDAEGWHIKRGANLGGGRILPFTRHGTLVHKSVLERMIHTEKAHDEKKKEGAKAKEGAKGKEGEEPLLVVYVPSARNWKTFREKGLIKITD